jgi:biopolymer transport protein TolR
MRHSRQNRRRSWMKGSSSVNLISMMDILTVLLLFLLKSYVAGGEVMVPPAGIDLPPSTADQPPQTSIVVAIDEDEIQVGGERVATVEETLSTPELEIASLAAFLQVVRERQDEIAQLQGSQPVIRLATIQGDRNIEFRVLQKVMFTLSQSGYESISLAVINES